MKPTARKTTIDATTKAHITPSTHSGAKTSSEEHPFPLKSKPYSSQSRYTTHSTLAPQSDPSYLVTKPQICSAQSESCFSTQNSDVEMSTETASNSDQAMEVDCEQLHAKVTAQYGSKILNNLLKRQVKLSGNFDRHEIKSSHRKQMVVWMEEVLKIFKCPNDTFFMAVHVMDRYIDQTNEELKLSDLHEIGITCMFLASKYQEVDPLTMDLMIEKVAHGKISERQLLARERKIASTLKFKFGVPNVLNFLESYMEICSPKIHSDDKVLLDENVIKIAKRSVLERKKAFNVLPSQLALYIIHKALRSLLELDANNASIIDFIQVIKTEISSDEDLSTGERKEVETSA